MTAGLVTAWWGALLWIALVFFLYPALLRLLGTGRRSPSLPPPPAASLPRLSVVVVLRNAAELVEDKIANCLALDYPADLIEFLFVSDGSTDATVDRLRAAAERDPRIRVTAVAEHCGKIHGMNLAAAAATGDLLLFSDADARLEAASARLLAARLAETGVGGACGQRCIDRADAGRLQAAQGRYISFDSRIKELESRLGSITANDGKLYLIRRRLYRSLPAGVTDDLFVLLTVVAAGYRFVFEPRARAWIRRPSRSPAHEWQRRRRIVATSLRGIWLGREALSLRHRPLFTLGLVINKVLRRLLALPLALLLATSIALAPGRPFHLLAAAAQLCFYALALLGGTGRLQGKAGRLAETALYFTLGVAASLAGVTDLLRGRVARTWEPVKGD